MNYTNNYHLPQWVETDRIQMEDFNDAMAAMDQGMAEAKVAAEAAQEAAGTAQAAAEIAQSSADAVADAYTPGNQPYVVGSYTGTGADMTITLGFRPKFLILSGMESSSATNSTLAWDRYFGLCDGTVLSNRLAFTDTGFLVRARHAAYGYFPDFTDTGRVYGYIAFR